MNILVRRTLRGRSGFGLATGTCFYVRTGLIYPRRAPRSLLGSVFCRVGVGDWDIKIDECVGVRRFQREVSIRSRARISRWSVRAVEDIMSRSSAVGTKVKLFSAGLLRRSELPCASGHVQLHRSGPIASRSGRDGRRFDCRAGRKAHWHLVERPWPWRCVRRRGVGILYISRGSEEGGISSRCGGGKPVHGSRDRGSGIALFEVTIIHTTV